MQKISVVTIVNNEEKHIRNYLENVKHVADEIIIMDSMSEDKTVEICREFTDKIFIQEFKGFGRQKQDAVAKASNEWILQIDADERLSKELIDEINKWKSFEPGPVAGYSIPFRLIFMGRHMRFGRCGGEYHIRLFKKASARYGDKIIHEGIKIKGKVGKLNSRIYHYSYDTLDEYFEKFNKYTTLIAKEKYKNGQRFHVWHFLRLPWEFVLRFFIKLGFLDGIPGLVYSILSAWYAFVKHLKIKDFQKNKN